MLNDNELDADQARRLLSYCATSGEPREPREIPEISIIVHSEPVESDVSPASTPNSVSTVSSVVTTITIGQGTPKTVTLVDSERASFTPTNSVSEQSPIGPRRHAARHLRLWRGFRGETFGVCGTRGLG
jgi:hypothetical protein